jgi:cellulose biosynthesis protein BcsQ
MPRIIALASPRTSSKTTNAAWLAGALHARGHRVKAFDADLSHQLTDWHAANQWPFPIFGVASKQAHLNIPQALGPDDVAVVDVGHIEEHLHIARSVLRISDLALINLVPTAPDLERLENLPLSGFLDDVNGLRLNGDLPVRILLTRCQPRTLATHDAREYMTEAGHRVLSTTVPAVQRYAQTGAGMPLDPRGSAHDELVTELEKEGLL